MTRRDRLVLVGASLVGVAPSLMIAFVLLWPGPNLIDQYGFYIGRDFVNFWTGAHLALTGKAKFIYDLAAYEAIIREFFAPSTRFLNFSYPPHILMLIWPLGLMPYGMALGIWVALGYALFLVTTLAATEPGARSRLWPLVMLAPIAILVASLAQASFFLAAMFLGAFRLLPRRPIFAGILIGCLSVKPQLGLLLPLVLLLQGEWRAIAAAAATCVLLVLGSMAILGLDPWRDYLVQTMPYQGRVVTEMVGLYAVMMITPYAGVRLAGGGVTPALLLQGVCALGIATTILIAWLRPVSRELRVLLLALGSLLVTPYCLNYDLVIPLAALMPWLAVQVRPLPWPTLLALAFLLATPFVGMVSAIAGLPLLPIVAAMAFIALGWEAWRAGRIRPTAPRPSGL